MRVKNLEVCNGCKFCKKATSECKAKPTFKTIGGYSIKEHTPLNAFVTNGTTYYLRNKNCCVGYQSLDKTQQSKNKTININQKRRRKNGKVRIKAD